MHNVLRYLAICAHPDDMEIGMGGTLIKLSKAGNKVKIVSLTNGNAGHYEMLPAELAARRKKEAERVSEYAALSSYEIWDINDGYLDVNVDNRKRLIRAIREFAPDVLFTFRLWDYHPDHRATSQLAQDASYLVTVPMFCQESPVPDKLPIILMTYDEFTTPCVFKPSIAVMTDDVIDAKVQMMAFHESQFFEWLAYDRYSLASVPQDLKDRLKWLKNVWLKWDVRQADKYRRLLVSRYGKAAEKCIYAESFELSEYGRMPEPNELNGLLPL